MKTLIVEDDFINRRIMQQFLAPYGSCEIAVNGKEGIEAFKISYEDSKPYDFICLDIMMPEMDGQELLKEIRRIESESDRSGESSARILMTTVLSDKESIMKAYSENCDGYIIKPIDKKKLIKQLITLGLIEEEKVTCES